MDALLATFWREEMAWVYGAVAVLALLLARFMAGGRAAVRHTLLLALMCALVDAAAAVFALRGQHAIGRGVHQAAVLGLGVVLIRLAGLAAYRVLLPALRLGAPRIVEDIVVIGGYLLWGLIRLSFAGVDLAGLVATSAVVTAVLAFAMQDTLGNILGGLALQLDDSLSIGDWVRLDDVSGRVVEIQWRFTAVLTRNGERVVIPNAQLMKGKFTVVGGPDGGGPGWRRWIGFNVDYGVPPAQVVAVALDSLADAQIPHVAREPAPSCVAMDFAPGSMRYALRYWLTDPEHDDGTDSLVRLHLLAALQRKGWRIALPDQALHVVQEGEAHRAEVQRRELDRRVAALAGIDLFASLDDDERRKIAARLIDAPFAQGDTITRQGAAAHWLYIIVAGEAEVWHEAPDGSRHLITLLPAGHVFGEMGLLTGAPRSATVVAKTDVACFRLDKAGFEDILHQRHELAESLSRVLEDRQHQNELLMKARAAPADDAERAGHRADLLQRIRRFFGLA